MNLSAGIKRFESFCPDGFRGTMFDQHERKHKAKGIAHGERLWQSLEDGEWDALGLDKKIARVKRVVASSRLLHSVEAAAFAEGLKDSGSVPLYIDAATKLLRDRTPRGEHFDEYAESLRSMSTSNMTAAKWPVATALLSMCRPRDYIAVKPRSFQEASKLLGAKVRYSPRVDWYAYESVLDFARDCLEGLVHFGAKDLSDVQSFFWVIGGGWRVNAGKGTPT